MPRYEPMSSPFVFCRLVVLESGLGLNTGLESIFAGLGLGLEIKGLGLELAVFGLGLGPYWTCYKAHSLQVCIQQ